MIVVILSGLWGVIHTSGIIGALGAVEWLTREDYHHTLNANVLGLIGENNLAGYFSIFV